MHRAIPTPSKLLSKKWAEHDQQVHNSKLKAVKSRIASASPHSYPHLQQRLKRQQLIEGMVSLDRFTEIERENRILLEKMSTILNAKAQDHPLVRPKSLNKIVRKRHLEQITAENQAILKRLKQRTPTYRASQWVETQRHMEEIVRLRCEFPYQLTDMLRPKTSARPQRRSTTPTPGVGRVSPLLRPNQTNERSKTMVTLEDKLVVFRGETAKLTVEMSTDQRLFWVVAFDKEGPESYSAELRVEEAVDLMGDNGYEGLMNGMKVEAGRLVLKGLTGGYTAR